MPGRPPPPFPRESLTMHVTAKADYAVRAVVELASGSQDSPRKVDEVAQAQGIPAVVPGEHPHPAALRRASSAASAAPRAATGSRKPPEEVNLAQVIRAVEGPLVGVRGQRPEEVAYEGSAESLQQVWIALRANLRKVLEHVTRRRRRRRQAAQGDPRADARRGSLADALRGTCCTRRASGPMRLYSIRTHELTAHALRDESMRPVRAAQPAAPQSEHAAARAVAPRGSGPRAARAPARSRA